VVGIRPGDGLREPPRSAARNDIVLAIDDRPFLSGDLAVAREGPERLRLHVLREGGVVVLEQPATAAERATLAEHVALMSADTVLLQPTPGSAALAAGLRSGDRAETVDGTTVREWRDMRKAIERAGDRPITMTVRRVRSGALPSFYDPAQQDRRWTRS
jgi:membrane-associated protease RseP (regulator of RpoE activity)